MLKYVRWLMFDLDVGCSIGVCTALESVFALFTHLPIYSISIQLRDNWSDCTQGILTTMKGKQFDSLFNVIVEREK